MDYQERRPAPPLRPYIECFWQLQGQTMGDGDGVERVLPDGRVEFVFNCGDVVYERGRGEAPSPARVAQPRTIVIGAADRALFIQPTGRVDCFGIRFRRGGVAAFLRVQASELTNDVIDLSALRSMFPQSFRERLCEGEIFPTRMRIASDALTHHIHRASPTRSPVLVAVGAIERTDGAIDIANAARLAGLGVRQLERRFRDEVGVSPKVLARLVRFSALVRQLASSAPMPLARLAAQAGYHDQSHLARDFREFAGQSAFTYLRETHQWTDHFFRAEPEGG